MKLLKNKFLIKLVVILFTTIPQDNCGQTIPKVLHISFHLGCIKEFEEVARTLPINLTSWYVHDNPKHFDAKSSGASIYNIGQERASRIWDTHKNYFDQFDLILTSDTAPLSRIFLQNHWAKPLIIWVCNRFDYCDRASLDCNFPDQEFYRLFQKAAYMPNVKIISYTPYELAYAKTKGISWEDFTIKPVGPETRELLPEESSIPSNIDQAKTIFVHPRLESWGSQPGRQFTYLQSECNERGISVYMGNYNGPDDIKKFKGVIFFPYAWSNLALFENIQRGIIHFVPTIRFINELRATGKPVTYDPEILFGASNLCEWYAPEHRDILIYFDSWNDLKEKIITTDYLAMQEKIKSFGKEHRKKMLLLWEEAFGSLMN
ncbi:MAG: hypothetical protein M1114_05935 [Candidatus Dependentiae bacterium]|nr:hypothetical protein [Candidatus Dependentiae bacterium]